MFAVIKTGGKQYKVQAGDMLRVEKLAADAGETVQFNDILMLGGDKTVVGAPLIAGAGVQAEVVDVVKADKVISFIKRRRKHGSKQNRGHRQKLTLVKITDILESGADKTGVKAAIGAGSVSAVAIAAAEPKKAAKPAKSPKAEATAAGDDLTQITGVGPAAAAKLNAAGLTTFAQVAALSEDDIAGIDAVKIKPEWVEQAKELAKG